MSHIIIIGAGASGLMAACEFSNKNHPVTLVEARDRIGGRAHTLPDTFSIPMEAGAEFIHGQKPLTMSLMMESKLKVSTLEGNRYQLWKGEIQKGDALGDDWEKLLGALKKLKKDVTMDVFLNTYFGEEKFRDLRQHVKGFVEGYDAADLHRVSAFALREEWENTDDEHQYHIHGGYVMLMNCLLEKARGNGSELLLSSPVTEIHWSPGAVRVVLQSGKVLEGDKVIITVPMGVLQKGLIQFFPALPDRERAFAKMGVGGIIKFLFEFHTPFWEEHRNKSFRDVAFIFSDAPVPTWWSQRPDKTPVLTGWFGGPETFTQVHNIENFYNRAIESLQYIFDCSAAEIKSAIKSYRIIDWTKDPFAYGAYGYETVESREARNVLTTPVMDTIYFAGEAIYTGMHMGTMEAALVSGQDVAGQIVLNAS